MSDIQKELLIVLIRAAERLRHAGLPVELADQMERLAGQVDQRCVVAIVGRVKAGKSTFINALLGADLAKVGTTETTATINWFRYGRPNPERPVHCHWRDGTVTEETLEFLNGLQGADIDTLRLSEDIDHLEYYLLNPYLEQIALVDTPGLDAAVGEHQDRLAKFMRVHPQLRKRHAEETQQIGRAADAVIYLLGEVARATDREFLEAFGQIVPGDSQAFKAVGVMAKIDIHPEIVEKREQLAAKVAAQLRHSLNTVIPVSAGIRRALDRLLENDSQGLESLAKALKRIPQARLQLMLDGYDLFRMDVPDCPVPVEERQRLLDDLDTDWMIFSTIARTVASVDLDTAVRQLDEIAGFDRLRKVLEQHFLKRGQFLRCYRIATDARSILNAIKYRHLPERHTRDVASKVQLERFLKFISNANGDTDVARELGAFVQRQLAGQAGMEGTIGQIEQIDRDLSGVFHKLEEYNEDFKALQLIEEHRDAFEPAELDELRPLLGSYGMEVEQRLQYGYRIVERIEERQHVWGQIATLSRNPIRRDVAQRAVWRYGLILAELSGGVT